MPNEGPGQGEDLILLQHMVEGIPALDEKSMARARIRQSTLTKPEGSLGRLEELCIQLAGIRSTERPAIKQKTILVMAADHGVVAEGVSHFPQAVTAQMVRNFMKGGAAVNVLSRHVGARVTVVDMGVASELPSQPGLEALKIATGTKNMAQGPAMTKKDALQSVETGFDLVERQAKQGLDLLGLGDMGIGNTTAASAITAAFTGAPVPEVTGRGTGLDAYGLQHKIEVIEQALEVNRPNRDDPMDVLAKVGGFEIGGLAGAILGAAKVRIPVILDGFITGAAALIAVGLAPQAKGYLIASHRSVENGHLRQLDHLGLNPLLDLGLRLGEGTGAALGMSLLEAACKILDEMATFEEAGISSAIV